MKGIYIAIIAVGLLVVAMIALTFYYLDQQRHQTMLYALFADNVLMGYEKIDRYLLENSVVFKSSTELPRDIEKRKVFRKIAFDVREKEFKDYIKNVQINGAKSLVHISVSPEKTEYLATDNATFVYLDNVPRRGNDIPFEVTSLATYPSLVRRYNFKKRGEQYVNIISPVSTSLPPVSDTVTIDAIGIDTIKIEGRDIQCERLSLESKKIGFVSLWVTRTFHNVLMVDVRNYGFKAVLCAEKEPIPVKEYRRKSELYVEKEIAFTNGETELYGTLTIPTKETLPLPAVLLIWGKGPLDRDARGLFTDIAHTLAESGYCVLRFDKRGVGQNKDSTLFATYDQVEEIADIVCALDFLKSQPEIDKDRIGVVGHSEGGFYAAYIAGHDYGIRACVLLSAPSSLNPLENNCNKLLHTIKRTVSYDNEYCTIALASLKKSRMMLDESDWITILGQRLFTKKMKNENKYNPLETVKKIKVPVLILHGRKDAINDIEEAEALGKALAEGGNNNFTMIYFGDMDHRFGKFVRKPPFREHIEVEEEVLKSLLSWLDENLASPLTESVTETTAAEPSADRELSPSSPTEEKEQVP